MNAQVSGELLMSVFLPFSDTAITVTPDRVMPVMAFKCHLPNIVFVDLYTKTGFGQKIAIAVFIDEYLFILQVIEQIIAFVVMDPGGLLLDKSIR